MPSGTIARPRGVVKRPQALDLMPVSCRIVFDVVRTLPSADVSLRELAQMTRLSPAQVRRALIRLHGAHLVRWERGAPGRSSRVVCLWRTFPQPGVSPAPNKKSTPERDFSHTGLCPQLTNRAHRWAMARLREEIRGYPIGWARRNLLLAALGRALLASIAAGRISTPRDLRKAVTRLLGLLRIAEAVSTSPEAAHKWATWAVATATR